MARSYKKSPCYTDRPDGAKYWKNLGNRKVRRSDDLFPKGNKYKKVYNSWEIHDYVSRLTKKDAEKLFYKYYEDEMTKDEYINKRWKKFYLRK